MPTLKWIGAAKPIAQVQTFVFAGTWEADDVIRVTFSNGKAYDFTGGSVTIATVITTLVAAWNALSTTNFPEFAEITASVGATSATLRLDGDTAGKPFTVTLTPLEANLGAADAQTIEGAGTATTGTALTACSGPNFWNIGANWSGGAIPASGDTVIIENSAISILYGLSNAAVLLDTFKILASFTGTIGLPNYTTSGTTYAEYRDTYLAIGFQGSFLLEVGFGPGAGSSRIKINAGTTQCTCNVSGTGQAAETGVGAFIFKGTSASNVMQVSKGSVSVAPFTSETANLSGGCTLGYEESKSSDVKFYAGSGTTFATLTQYGGDATINSAVTTLTRYDGTMTVEGNSIAITTVNNHGGTLYDNAGGTITTLNNAATYDRTRTVRARTITNTITTYKAAKLIDPNGTLVITGNGITFAAGVDWPDVTVQQGKGKKWVPTT